MFGRVFGPVLGPVFGPVFGRRFGLRSFDLSFSASSSDVCIGLLAMFALVSAGLGLTGSSASR